MLVTGTTITLQHTPVKSGRAMIFVMSLRKRIMLYWDMDKARPQSRVQVQHADGGPCLRMVKGVIDIRWSRP